MLNTVDFKEIIEAIDKVATFIQTSVGEEASIKAAIKRCEDRQQDILHEIEFSVLSRKQRDILAKELKDIRVERRNAKNLLELIEPFTHLVKSKSASASFMSALATKVSGVMKEQEARFYAPKSGAEGLKINPEQHYEVLPTDNNRKFIVKKANK